MVSFSCENCGDVLTKKKLDPHRNQCRGASYTCLDCMVHFHGTEYRSHTSCISEAQKYMGATYKEKNSKSRKPPTDSQALVPRNAYVEDAVELDEHNGGIAVIDVPPRAPSPPPVNVFDFLVEENHTPSVPRVTFPDADESRMIEDVQEQERKVEFHNDAEDRAEPAPQEYHVEERVPGGYPTQDEYAETGFSYGHTPVQPSFERYDSYTARTDTAHKFVTPAPKASREARVTREKDTTVSKSKSDKKRKRGHVDNLDMALVRAQAERDSVMTDAPPVLHSGLTGGLNRLLSRPEFPPSPDYSGGDWVDASPMSPLKRSKQAHAERERGRDREPKPRKASSSAHRAVQMNGHSANTRTRRVHRERDDSNKERVERRQHRRSRRSASVSSQEPERASPPRRAVKRIEYRVTSNGSDSAGHGDSKALVLHRSEELDRNGGPVVPFGQSRADLFMGFVNKGPDSERGLSINKALKRYHRERGERFERGAEWGGLGKIDEEKELWKSLRLKKNDRGEIVVFF